MKNVIFLSGPMGSGIRPKKYFEATRELMRKQALSGQRSEQRHSSVKTNVLKTA